MKLRTIRLLLAGVIGTVLVIACAWMFEAARARADAARANRLAVTAADLVRARQIYAIIGGDSERQLISRLEASLCSQARIQEGATRYSTPVGPADEQFMRSCADGGSMVLTLEPGRAALMEMQVVVSGGAPVPVSPAMRAGVTGGQDRLE